MRFARGEAVLVLAGLPLAKLTADAQAWCYATAKAIRLVREVEIPRVVSQLRVKARRRAIDAWRKHLVNDRPATGIWTLEAVLPHLDE